MLPIFSVVGSFACEVLVMNLASLFQSTWLKRELMARKELALCCALTSLYVSLVLSWFVLSEPS